MIPAVSLAGGGPCSGSSFVLIDMYAQAQLRVRFMWEYVAIQPMRCVDEPSKAVGDVVLLTMNPSLPSVASHKRFAR